MWAESTIGNWIVITSLASAPLGALRLSVSNQCCMVGGVGIQQRIPGGQPRGRNSRWANFLSVSPAPFFLAQITLVAY